MREGEMREGDLNAYMTVDALIADVRLPPQFHNCHHPCLLPTRLCREARGSNYLLSTDAPSPQPPRVPDLPWAGSVCPPS